jgi:DNA replication and repair protein RecF
MLLRTLQLVNFRNYEQVKLEFSPNINVLVGTNGSGKTNLLDSIYYLSLTKSAFSASDNFLIRHDEKFFSIKALFEKEEKSLEVFCAVQIGSKKVVREEGKEYNKVSDHIGKYPVVLIAPDDTDLVKEGSEERRKFFDTIISQLDKPYLESLIQYNQALKQRNTLLKMFADSHKFDDVALQSYDHVLSEQGTQIHKRRLLFMDEFAPIFRDYYSLIAGAETADLEYSSEVKDLAFTPGLLKSREKDLFLQRTNFGIHRDDYTFSLHNGELKRLGSQGQKKSFVIALKLAHFAIMKKYKGEKPILLLDDIFDKLDDLRIEKILMLIKNDEFGQLFISDARPDRTAGLLDEIGVPANIYTVENGTVIEE